MTTAGWQLRQSDYRSLPAAADGRKCSNIVHGRRLRAGFFVDFGSPSTPNEVSRQLPQSAMNEPPFLQEANRIPL
jgi:hypothetical protein